MLPMTPLQSWAFLVLILLAVGIAFWTFAIAPYEELDEDLDLFEPDDEPDADITARPQLTLIEGGLRQRELASARPVYDWARDGL